jgi:hypothetical protein
MTVIIIIAMPIAHDVIILEDLGMIAINYMMGQDLCG